MKKSKICLWIGIICIVLACLADGFFSGCFDNTTVPDWTPIMWVTFGIVGLVLALGIVLIVYSRKIAKKERLQEQSEIQADDHRIN